MKIVSSVLLENCFDIPWNPPQSVRFCNTIIMSEIYWRKVKKLVVNRIVIGTTAWHKGIRLLIICDWRFDGKVLECKEMLNIPLCLTGATKELWRCGDVLVNPVLSQLCVHHRLGEPYKLKYPQSIPQLFSCFQLQLFITISSHCETYW